MPGLSIVVTVSPGLKSAVERAAQADDLDVSKWVRKVMADAVGYNLDVDNALSPNGRPRKYTTERERREARNEKKRNRERRGKAVVDAIMRQQKLENIDALEKWLTARGINLDDEQ